MQEMMPVLIALIAFASVVGVVFVVGQYVSRQSTAQRRLPAAVSSAQAAEIASSGVFGSIAGRIDERRFGVDDALRTKLRKNLIRAGYFSSSGVRYYVLARIGAVLVLPTLAFIFGKLFLESHGPFINLGVVGITAVLAIIGPDAYIARRQRIMQREYRLNFPDLIDMLVVCVDAGLSLDMALNRVAAEAAKQANPLAVNLAILNAETRAGRSLPDALSTFADRLDLDEARALGILLRQSLDLGTDISDALRVFSDEMRTKRLLRAEENANKLPVKMVVPLGLCIFPVILMVVMIPMVVRLAGIFYRN